MKLVLSPQQQLSLQTTADNLQPALQARIQTAFGAGAGAGLLQLGARELRTELPGSLAWFRRLGQLYMSGLCALPDLEEQRERVSVPPPADALAALAASPPPMDGAEYLDAALLERLWSEIEAACRRQLAAHTGTVEAWLHAQSPVWNRVGRVCLHLAENKRDPSRPFAFLATYAVRLSAAGQLQHQPLGRALKQSAQTGDRQQLITLLEPVQRAAKESTLIGELVESRAIFSPQRWDARQAHRFLRDLPALEAAGLSIRVPAWWHTGRPPRPRVSVSIGGREQTSVGLTAMLSFSIEVAVDGAPLSPEEIAALLEGHDGLVMLRGRWVEVDTESLAENLERWQEVAEAAVRDGISFAEGMRLLAGAPSDLLSTADDAADWSDVTAGPWLQQLLAQLRDPGQIGATTEPGEDFRATLRPYQREGVRWLSLLTSLGLGACLADDMGLGKTIQVLALLSLQRQAPRHGLSLLVVPTSLITNWKNEIRRFFPRLRVVVAHRSELGGSRLELAADTELVITTYGTLHRLKILSQQDWDLIVLDEAQAIKNPDSRRSRAVRALKGRARIAVTGTPVENRLQDLWTLFDFINPGLLGSPQQFKGFVKALGDDYAPLRSLISPYLLRRLKRDPRVIQDLPDKTEVKVYCGLSHAQAALYADSVEDLAEQLRTIEPKQRRGIVLAFLMRFKQICNHPSLWLSDGAFAPEDSAKMSRLGELCEMIAQRQEKVLLFTQFRSMIPTLSAFLEGIFGRPGATLHGGTSVKRRAALVEAFQRDDGPPFFILSLRAGGTGLNLTAAAHVVHFDRWWNPAVEDQATDRAYRIGQKQNVLVHKFVCRGTIEEQIDRMIEDKAALVDELIGGDGVAAGLTALSDDDLLKLVRLDINTATLE